MPSPIVSMDGELIPAIARFLSNKCTEKGFTVNWNSFTRQTNLAEPIGGAITYSIPAFQSGSNMVYEVHIVLRLTGGNRSEVAKDAANWFAFIRDYCIPELSEGLQVNVGTEVIDGVMKSCMMEYCHFPEEEIDQDYGSTIAMEFVVNWKNDGVGVPENFTDRFY